MRDGGLLNVPARRPGFIADTFTAKKERQTTMMEDARGPGYQQQVRARQLQHKLHHHQFKDMRYHEI